MNKHTPKPTILRLFQIILFLTAISCSSFRERDVVEVIDPIDFLSFVLSDTTDLNLVPHRHDIVSDISILGPPSGFVGAYSDFLITILAETDTLFIKDQLRQSINFRTDKLEEHGFTIIKISDIRLKTGNYWDNLLDTVGSGIFSIDRPIFNKNYTLAYVRYGFICGPLCGGGSDVILEKKAGKWIIKEILSTWVS